MTSQPRTTSPRARRLTHCGLLVIVGVAGALSATTASGQSASRSARPDASTRSNAARVLPTPAEARSIVGNLWEQREGALSLLNPSLLDPYEAASALRQDGAYLGFVLCGCDPKKDPHPADRVVPQIPKGTGGQVFFAQVHTTNTKTHRHPWYVVAVARAGADWKISFVTLGSYAAAPPLGQLTGSSAYTLAETGDTRARMVHLARAAATQAAAQDAKVRHTGYGAAIHTHDAVEPAKDGVYGLSLPSQRVLSCFTLHTLETYSMAQGLQQDAARRGWSNLLAPGTYSSITFDSAVSQCVVGASAGTAPGTLRMQYDAQIVAVTGVPR
jgi:hypothetical protein